VKHIVHHNQAPRQDLAAGEAKNQKEGPKTRRGDQIFKIQYWMYAAIGGPNVKCGSTDFKWGGRAPPGGHRAAPSRGRHFAD